MDRLSPQRRSWLMSRVRSKNTTPEMRIRSALHSMGYRYRVHLKHLPGKPDVVFTKRRKVIFIHGCFWHGHEGCRYAKLPKTRIEFWSEKVSKNRTRDRLSIEALTEAGWSVLVVWQCELKDFSNLIEKLCDFIETKK